MTIWIRSSAAAGGFGGASRRITRTVLAAGLLSAGLAASAQAAHAADSVSVRHRTLIVQGSAERLNRGPMVPQRPVAESNLCLGFQLIGRTLPR